MTDCCLCVCWRPSPHKRFLQQLYIDAAPKPEGAPANAGKLVGLATSVPALLSVVSKELCDNLHNQLKHDDIK